MNNCDPNATCLPDVASEPMNAPKAALNWVGMSEIETPIHVPVGNGQTIASVARVQAYVNLTDPNSKGIHMSRLYIAIDKKLANNTLTPKLMNDLVNEFVDSHEGISDSAYIEVRFDYALSRPALLSDNQGWKSYKTRIISSIKQGQVHNEISVEVPYSSTCPCSAALSRDLIKNNFLANFEGQDAVSLDDAAAFLSSLDGINATPHSQRSIAQVRACYQSYAEQFPLLELIDSVEDALKTPVQSAVKREDEQEFARLNAANLMFCEDAARKLYKQLDDDQAIADFWVRVNHMESLHPHDAVAIVVKGVEGGYSDSPREFPH